jgi:hypothetical protein
MCLPKNKKYKVLGVSCLVWSVISKIVIVSLGCCNVCPMLVLSLDRLAGIGITEMQRIEFCPLGGGWAWMLSKDLLLKCRTNC